MYIISFLDKKERQNIVAMTLNEFKFILYFLKYLKTLIMEKIKIIKNEENFNSYAITHSTIIKYIVESLIIRVESNIMH
jgi:hypothetical protein